MLRYAPKFYEVAKRIIEITQDCIIVAHNAKFDYRLLKTEFNRLGFDYQRQSLCTVELSKKLLPDLPSYSLGKLTKSLGIPMSKRHRAEGDAKATVTLLKILLEKDREKQIIKEHVRLKPKKQVDTKLLNLLENLPKEAGVYFFYNENDELLYVGKSKNIYKRVNQHFTNTSSKSKTLQRLTEEVSFEIAGNELMALLKENEYIKNLKPKYNRALTKTKFSHGIIIKEDKQGYLNLKVRKVNDSSNFLATFSGLKSARNFIEHVVEKYELCMNKTSLNSGQKSCFNYGIKACQGACVAQESAKDYNKRVRKLIDKFSFEKEDFVMVGKGREVGEKSLIYVKSGQIYGFGYFSLNLQITNKDILERIISPVKYKRDAKHIIQSFMRQYPNRFQLVEL
jgi:DNA polymerase-3 subunit epsilon